MSHYLKKQKSPMLLILIVDKVEWEFFEDYENLSTLGYSGSFKNGDFGPTSFFLTKSSIIFLLFD